ncbi:unnamed protein product [Schistosoma margrebowiei]|uniref:Uncharacterized protein n=1 Tax=Schistosoma margrebowiei TaxID=48269 RepID=A0A3P8AWV5_9TREM|nr:unnamed protein product [Schistosoma margrebowiei]
MDFIGIDHAQTESRHYGSSLNNHLSGTRYYTLTSLTMRRRLAM